MVSFGIGRHTTFALYLTDKIIPALFVVGTVLLYGASKYIGAGFTWGYLWLCYIMILSVYVGARIHPTVGLALAWSLWPATIAGTLDQYSARYSIIELLQFKLRWSMMSSAFSLSLLAVFLSSLRSHTTRTMLRTFAWLMLANSLFVVVQRQFVPVPGGFLHESTVNACAIAMSTPLMLMVLRGMWMWLLLLPALAVSLAHSTIAIIIMGVVWTTYLWRVLPFCRLAVLTVGALGILVWGMGMQGIGFLHDGNRFEGYERVLEQVTLWGRGNGTFLALTAQVFGKFSDKFWLHPHSALLRVMFEQGIVGALLWGVAWMVAVAKAWRDPVMLSALAGVTCFVVSSYPLWLPVQGLLCALIARWVFHRRTA